MGSAVFYHGAQFFTVRSDEFGRRVGVFAVAEAAAPLGDHAVADRNGRQLAFAALSGLEALPQPGTYFEYAGPVVSGAILGTWKHKPLSDEARSA
jgi:hypothetical protein